MNAYFELLGSYEYVKSEQAEKVVLSLETADVELERTARNGTKVYAITPHHDAACVREWLNNVLWADIERNDYHKDKIRAVLKSDRTLEDEEEFLNALGSIDYDDSYGTQELYGYVVFKDNTWLERHEYDGSEWWVHCVCPQEPDWDKDSEENSEDNEDSPIESHYDNELEALESLKKYL